MKADGFDRQFEAGADITAHLDLASTRRPGLEPRAVQLDLPTWMIDSLDRQARRIGVTRQDLNKVWLAERPRRITSDKSICPSGTEDQQSPSTRSSTQLRK